MQAPKHNTQVYYKQVHYARTITHTGARDTYVCNTGVYVSRDHTHLGARIMYTHVIHTHDVHTPTYYMCAHYARGYEQVVTNDAISNWPAFFKNLAILRVFCKSSHFWHFLKFLDFMPE